MSARERLVDLAGWVQRSQLWIAAAALVILMMVTVVDVFMRYLFNRPIRASLDTVEVMLLVFVFNGMAAAFFGRRHIVIDLLDGVLGARITGVLIRIADVLSVLCLGLLVWAMRLPATQAYQYGDAKMELPIPIYVLWIVALVEPCRDDLLRAGHAGGEAGHSRARARRMSPSLIGATGVVVLFALLLLRVPVWIALILVGFFGNVLVNGWPAAFALAGTAPFDVASSYTLSVVPLFILMGEVASGSRLSGELFNAARVILSGFRGGLAVATLAASALFGAVSGSSLANAATMTRMALPELRKAGYDDGLATGCIAAGGSTDILIPPSIILVIYAAIAELSVPKLLGRRPHSRPGAHAALHRGRARGRVLCARTTRPIATASRGASASPPCGSRGNSSCCSS